MPVRRFPPHPNLDHLRHQAKDLLRALRNGDPAAIDDFRTHHSPAFDCRGATLADAQLVLARSYQASSWPELVVVCEVLDATAHDDVEVLRDLLARHPHLTRDAGRDAASGWMPVVANAADLSLHRVIRMLQAHGARGVAETRARAHLRKWLDMLRLLGQLGAQPPRDAIGGAVELLKGEDFAFMMEVGTSIEDWRPSIALALETYARNPDGKHRILDSIDRRGTVLPDTSPMAVHRGRLDLLARHLERDPRLLTRRFSHDEIYPTDLGCHSDHALALHGAPLDGATLLHMAVDYEDLAVARWLLDRGMDVDIPAIVNGDGFGGHTPLFNVVVTYNAGRTSEPLAELLLDRGADPNRRASIRKGLAFARDPSVHEYRDVTPLGWGRQFHDQSYVSPGALRLLAERGGRE